MSARFDTDGLLRSLCSLNFDIMTLAALADNLCVREILVLAWLLVTHDRVEVCLLSEHVQIVEQIRDLAGLAIASPCTMCGLKI